MTAGFPQTGAGGSASTRGWMSYDSVADIYERVAVPGFTPMAHDLISAVEPASGEKVLDLGTGTGLVARLASPMVAPDGCVVGVDPSIEMLRRVPAIKSFTAVAAMAPGLPFAGEVFDAVTANLVLSHLPDLRAGLRDVVRVSRQGARLGCTAWASPLAGGAGNQRPEADEIVASVRQQCGLDVPPPREDAVPFEDQLCDRDVLVEVLEGAGLVDLTVGLRRYERMYTVHEFLSGWGSQGRYLRHAVGERQWGAFVGRAAEALQARFGDAISSVNEAWVVTGWRR